NPKHLGAEIGMTMVLHTNTRRLDYHPHVHVVLPGGGIDKRRLWKNLKGKYLFNGKALAKKFRGRFLAELALAGLVIPEKTPEKWVAHCEHVGRGGEVLKYLSRYLYRGVVSEKNIVANHDGRVTFRYLESKTGVVNSRTLAGEDFLHLVLQHVLPKGFRRVRDYGFLHGNAKKLRFLVQLILHVIVEQLMLRPRPVFKCPCCKASMVIVGFRRSYSRPG
ncbi:MAG: IS91 family transposase, partial [Bacteroidetes bacterium]|nr:IS91 family transposase [Bacteroidota bacterium]